MIFSLSGKTDKLEFGMANDQHCRNWLSISHVTPLWMCAGSSGTHMFTSQFVEEPTQVRFGKNEIPRCHASMQSPQGQPQQVASSTSIQGYDSNTQLILLA